MCITMKSKNAPKRIRTPNCTHVNMDRVFGRDQQCHVCGRSPSIGFLYQCKQDYDSESLRDLLPPEEDMIEPVKSNLRVHLESIGLSESTILNAESGCYTDAQLTKLTEQKLELRQAILDIQEKNDLVDDVAKLKDLAKGPSNNDGAGVSRQAKVTTSSGCSFKACHTCRPYYRDRVYISFEAVLSAEFAPLMKSDLEHLPIKSSRIMRNIGETAHWVSTSLPHTATPTALLVSPSCATSSEAPQTASTTSTGSSQLTFKTTQTDFDEISAQRRPRRRFYTMGRRSSQDIARDLTRLPAFLTRQGFKSVVQGFFRAGREPSSSGSNITLPLPRTGTVRDLSESQSVGEFDLGALRRVRRQKERNDLRNGTYTGGFEYAKGGGFATTEHAEPRTSYSGEGGGTEETANSDSSFSLYSCVSEGSEVEVDGGVALTEEAVVKHTPDILALNVAIPKDGSVYRDEEVGEEDDGADGFDLQSVMAQA